MLAIGKALLTNPKLILLDEPTQGLAPNIVIQLTEILKAIIKEGISIVIVEQNVNMALKIANHVAIIGKGETKWRGSKDDFLKIYKNIRNGLVYKKLLTQFNIFIASIKFIYAPTRGSNPTCSFIYLCYLYHQAFYIFSIIF